MLIKYKGNTSALLTDLSLELKIPVNLKKSETILQIFFDQTLRELSMEKSIEFISSLPPHLKPFCSFSGKDLTGDNEHFSKHKISLTTKAITTVLEKYVQPENLAKIYSFLPANTFADCISLKKEVLIAA